MGGVTRDFILQHDYAVNGLVKKLEYVKGFINNGYRAWRRHELGIRVKLRWNRIKLINRRKMEE